MSLVWQDGQFSWAFIMAAIYLVALLFAADLAWRLTPLGGWRLLCAAAGAAVGGIVLIAALLG